MLEYEELSVNHDGQKCLNKEMTELGRRMGRENTFSSLPLLRISVLKVGIECQAVQNENRIIAEAEAAQLC